MGYLRILICDVGQEQRDEILSGLNSSSWYARSDNRHLASPAVE